MKKVERKPPQLPKLPGLGQRVVSRTARRVVFEIWLCVQPGRRARLIVEYPKDGGRVITLAAKPADRALFAPGFEAYTKQLGAKEG
jgi:hypothetical protein